MLFLFRRFLFVVGLLPTKKNYPKGLLRSIGTPLTVSGRLVLPGMVENVIERSLLIFLLPLTIFSPTTLIYLEGLLCNNTGFRYCGYLKLLAIQNLWVIIVDREEEDLYFIIANNSVCYQKTWMKILSFFLRLQLMRR